MATRDGMASDGMRLGGLALAALGGGFLTVIMLGASMAPGYDIQGGAISDLGVIEQTAVLFNVSLLAVGALNLLGGYLFYRSHRRLGVLAVFVVASIGAGGAGLFPLDRGGLHSLFALAAFLCFNLEAIAAATVVRGAMRAVSALAGLVGLVFVVLMVLGDGGNAAAFGPIAHGGTERMIVYPSMLWLLVFGGWLMASAGDGK